jgi:hypothetical protein
LSLSLNDIKSFVSLFSLIDDGTVGDDSNSGNQQKGTEQQGSGEEEMLEESESLLDAINKITLIKSC